MTSLATVGREHELLPVRRLSRADCDRLGYAGPLTLSVHEVRFLFGRRSRLDDYAAVHRVHGVVWRGSAAELRRLGVDPTATD